MCKKNIDDAYQNANFQPYYRTSKKYEFFEFFSAFSLSSVVVFQTITSQHSRKKRKILKEFFLKILKANYCFHITIIIFDLFITDISSLKLVFPSDNL